jgi:hypothetical protein
MKQLGYDPNDNSTDIETPTGIGNVACAAVLEFRHHDKSNQLGDLAPGPYSDWSGYRPVNSAGTVPAQSLFTKPLNPEHWQPLTYTDSNGSFVWRNFLPGTRDLSRPFTFSLFNIQEIGLLVVDSQMPFPILAETVGVDKLVFFLSGWLVLAPCASFVHYDFSFADKFFGIRMHSCSISLSYLPAFSGPCSGLLSPSRRALAALSVTLLWFRLFHSGLGGLLDLLRTLFANHAQGQRNRGKASDQGESQSGSFALIIVQPA